MEPLAQAQSILGAVPSLVPPLKWAGGKRWFAQNHQSLLPKSYIRYIEPFLGSGALYFSEKPELARLSDLNEELINFYVILRDSPLPLRKLLLAHQRNHSSEHYYRVRSSRPRTPLGRAARTLYLNRTCWNGLYRVNLQGIFNVPKGTKERVLLDTDDFLALSKLLKTAELICQDFEESINSAQAGDFIFVDPPYTVAHNNNGFIKYNQHLFRWEDQIRLRDSLLRAVRRGAQVLITNAAHASVEELYRGFEIMHIERAGVIAGASASRGKFTEMVARWY